MFGNADELLKFVKDEGVEFIDVRFTDLPGPVCRNVVTAHTRTRDRAPVSTFANVIVLGAGGSDFDREARHVQARPHDRLHDR